MARPEGIVDFTPSPAHYPFDSRWFESPVGPVHYLDEGQGRPLLLLHGNPEWGFVYRKLVLGLRDRFRCIAPDYPGFGLSAHPASSYGYTPAEHAEVVGALVDQLDLQDAVVMGQDWGGPIGMDVASRRPERISGLVMGNTWYWPADTLMLRSFSLIMGSPPLQWLIRQRNFFVAPLMKRLLRTELSSEEFEHYVRVVPTPASREGIAVFPRQIRLAGPWLAELQRRVDSTLTDRPIVLPWGLRDPAFGSEANLARWQAAFPKAEVVRLEQAGHYIQEDAPQSIIEAIVRVHGRA
jgi:haloalkane dehalogenase